MGYSYFATILLQSGLLYLYINMDGMQTHVHKKAMLMDNCGFWPSYTGSSTSHCIQHSLISSQHFALSTMMPYGKQWHSLAPYGRVATPFH